MYDGNWYKVPNGDLVTGSLDQIPRKNINIKYNTVGPSIKNIRDISTHKKPSNTDFLLSQYSINPEIVNHIGFEQKWFYDDIVSYDEKNPNMSNPHRTILYISDENNGGYGYKPYIHYHADNYIGKIYNGYTTTKNKGSYTDNDLINHLNGY